MIDHADIAATAIAAGATILAQGGTVVSQFPGLTEAANLTSTGAIIYIVLRTIPNLTKDFRDEMREEREHNREENEKLREAFSCKRDA
jgi:hypothetical protein